MDYEKLKAEVELQLIDNATEVYKNSLFSRVNNMVERIAITTFGQHIIERVDRVLNVFELTARWSLPTVDNKEKLSRPISWLPFLMLIIILRIGRAWLSLAALFIGNPPVTPRDVVNFIQTRRRKLRYIRFKGLREINSRLNLQTAATASAGVLNKLQTMFSSIICKANTPKLAERRGFLQNQVIAHDIDVEPQTIKRPREVVTHLMEAISVQEIIDKFANENSDDDSDYIPNIEEESSEETSSDSNISTDSERNQCTEEEQEKEKDKLKVTAIVDNVLAAKDKIAKMDLRENLAFVESLIAKHTANNLPVKENGEHSDGALSDIQTDISNELTLTMSSGSVETPNGKSNGPLLSAENYEVPVDNDCKTPAVPSMSGKNQLNVQQNDSSEKRKSTPGHLSAAISKPMLPRLGGVVSAAPPSDNVSLSVTHTITESNSPQTTAPTTPSDPFSDLMSSAIASDSSYRTPILTVTDCEHDANLSSASSSEDIFYSPIGLFSKFNSKITHDGAS